MTAIVLRVDSRTLPLADNTVDLVVTSPPYFGLRSYTDGGVHYAGQVGDEATPAEFIAGLLDVTRECVRVLKPSGSIWVNLGDKYVADNRGSGGDKKRGDAKYAPRGAGGFVGRETARQKSLIGLPWRYALACIDNLGLILRAEVIWSKPNGLPESVTDRVRRSHEQWFHFTLEPRYFSAVDEVREASNPKNVAYFSTQGANATRYANEVKGASNPNNAGRGIACNPLGKLPGSVWTIPTQPLQVPAHLGIDHFAAFPMEWPRRLIKGWSPSGICDACGEGRRPVVDKVTTGRDNSYDGRNRSTVDVKAWKQMKSDHPDRIVGESCACPTPDAPTRPAVVLDPFGGTGTTALVADTLGRVGISCDLSHDYSRLARWRTRDPVQRASAMQVEKPPVEVDGQDDLFGGAA